MKRRQAREQALKILFMIDVGGNDRKEAAAYVLENSFLSDKEKAFCEELVNGVCREKENIDSMLAQYLVNWQLERLAAATRNILRLALYEIIYLEEVPPPVSINEAIELAKKYQDENEARFVNGVLDSVRKSIARVQHTPDNCL